MITEQKQVIGLLCPKCEEFTPKSPYAFSSWRESVTVYTNYDPIKNKYAEIDEWTDVEHNATMHTSCSFRTEDWTAEDFTVKYDSAEKKFYPYGEYYEDEHYKDLEKINERLANSKVLRVLIYADPQEDNPIIEGIKVLETKPVVAEFFIQAENDEDLKEKLNQAFRSFSRRADGKKLFSVNVEFTVDGIGGSWDRYMVSWETGKANPIPISEYPVEKMIEDILSCVKESEEKLESRQEREKEENKDVGFDPAP
jgi:hypothetical protein